MISQHTSVLQVRAPRPGLHEITAKIASWVAQSGIFTGLLTPLFEHRLAPHERSIALHIIGE